jgi:hypothetical protein
MHLYKKMGIEIAKNYYLTFSEVEHKYNLKKHIKKNEIIWNIQTTLENKFLIRSD